MSPAKHIFPFSECRSLSFFQTGPAKVSPEIFQVFPVGMLQRLIKIGDQLAGTLRFFLLHRLISLPDGHRHLSLAHPLGTHCIALIQMTFYINKDPVKIFLALSKALSLIHI